jgi:hypothetical protein
MAETVGSLTARLHELLVASLGGAAPAAPAGGLRDLLTRAFTGTAGPRVDVVAGFRDLVARATVLGPDGTWLVAAGHAALAGIAINHGQTDQAISHFGGAVAAGYSDCVAVHAAPVRPLHGNPRFRAIYERMRVTEADLDELFWLHRETQIMASQATSAAIENIGRHDTGVSLLAQAALPTRTPHTAGVIIARAELMAAQHVLQTVAMSSDIQRSAGNIGISLIDDSWDERRGRRDAWRADELLDARRRAAAARTFVERPGAGTVLVPCPPLGSIPGQGPR